MAHENSTRSEIKQPLSMTGTAVLKTIRALREFFLLGEISSECLRNICDITAAIATMFVYKLF